ncbi:hypothetical protein [Effusibacillus consociatus]|uniref:PepSY domain-containing protein n=1 Tax=Effusibacillus consociatus TaxID=1117041 RepID=A0ABV9Q122_9BACL
MKKTMVIGISTLGLLATVLGVTMVDTTVNAGVKTEQNLTKLEEMDMKLELSVSPAPIDEDAAIESAKATFGGLVVGAKQVKVEYHMLTNKSFQLFSEEAIQKNPSLKTKGIDRLPVYIVTFKGVEIEQSGPKKQTESPKGKHSELNVVVDATTGVALKAFSYR